MARAVSMDEMVPNVLIESGLHGTQQQIYNQYPDNFTGANVFLENPAPTNLNFCCPPQTGLTGTAPYVLGRGAVSANIDIESFLRAHDTSRSTRPAAAGQPTPFDYIDSCYLPPRTLPFTRGGKSSRADYRNILLSMENNNN